MIYLLNDDTVFDVLVMKMDHFKAPLQSSLESRYTTYKINASHILSYLANSIIELLY